MPFTPTHVLAILPFATIKRLRLPFAALAIGSMIPDLPLFTRFGPSYQSTHSIPGLFTACLPLGLAAFFIFRSLMAIPLLALLPPVARQRMEPHFENPAPLTGDSLVLASIAIVVGSATHGFWDSFTHEDRWGTRHVASLNAIDLTVGGRHVKRYELLQYGCSALGLPLLAVIFYDRYRKLPEPVRENRPEPFEGRTRVLILAMFVLIAAACGGYGWVRFDRPVAARLHDAVTKAGFGLMAAILAYCLAYRWKFRKIEIF
ncbi:DUF4184 family protein [bacterium]|nr:DUF4184 family protein [bacterium]